MYFCVRYSKVKKSQSYVSFLFCSCAIMNVDFSFVTFVRNTYKIIVS